MVTRTKDKGDQTMIDESTKQYLEELKTLFPDEHVSIGQTVSFWPKGMQRGEETNELYEIEIGSIFSRHMFHAKKFHGPNLDEVMEEARRFGYEDRICAECHY